MLAMNPDKLAKVRKKLQGNIPLSPLFDTEKYCRNLEKAYVLMWQRNQNGMLPINLSVDNAFSYKEELTVPKAVAMPIDDSLPIHFFTIVLNGQPFIRYHIDVFRHLPFNWHWHIVEGVADLKHDTSWSLRNGGHIADDFHRQGLSIDGTTEYINWLKKKFPEHVTIYRKPSGIFWDGKLEMVNAPLANISVESLLWQVDVDEFWTHEQFCTARKMFVSSPTRRAAFYWCSFFVGPQLMVSTRNCYSQNPGFEWHRTWRFTPGCKWSSHEPPQLIEQQSDGTEKSLATMSPFLHAETVQKGLVFQHFAYVLREQLLFKEHYYGYKDAERSWDALQSSSSFPVVLKEYLPWVKDSTQAGISVKYGIIPIPLPSCALNSSADSLDNLKVIIDGVFLQYYKTGIARVWLSLLREWRGSEFSKKVLILDRDGTFPEVAGYRIRKIPRHDYADLDSDRQMLQKICDEERASLFISTYYSYPITTPLLLMVHDMIPELQNINLSIPMWQEKRASIGYASSFVAVSHNTALDLGRFHPEVVSKGIDVVLNGFDSSVFYQATELEINEFRSKYCKGTPYYLHVGARGGYKNDLLFVKAFALLPDFEHYTIVLTGNNPSITELAGIVPAENIVMVGNLSDDMLRAAYSGAIALVFPSRCEGFGLPVLEAMACGCPVITCNNSSLTEVGGDAVMFVSPDNPDELMKVMLAVRSESLRSLLIQRGFFRSSIYSWKRMASELLKAIVRVSGNSQGDLNISLEDGAGFLQ